MPHPSKLPLPISVAIICKNNADTIGRTLESVRGLAQEIIAVDSGSTDGTLEILREHKARVIEIRWMGYVETVRYAFEQCIQPWVLPLDSDESLEPQLRRSIEALDLEREDGPTGYRVNRKVFYGGRFFEYTWQPEWRLRLVRKDRYEWHGINPHYDLRPVDPGEPIEDLAGDLRHDSFASFADLMRKHVGHAELMAQGLHATGKRAGPTNLLFSPITSFVRQAIFRRGYKDGTRGWAAAGAMAAYTLMKYVCLLELKDKAGESRSPSQEQRSETE